jgi:hypothetical protein
MAVALVAPFWPAAPALAKNRDRSAARPTPTPSGTTESNRGRTKPKARPRGGDEGMIKQLFRSIGGQSRGEGKRRRNGADAGATADNDGPADDRSSDGDPSQGSQSATSSDEDRGGRASGD